MATSYQPLLTPTSPKWKTSSCKALCLVLSLAAIIAPMAIFTTNLLSSKPSLTISQLCDKALDKPTCLSMVSEVASGRLVQTQPLGLLQTFLNKSTSDIHYAVKTAEDVRRRINDPKEQSAVTDCLELMDLSVDRITDSIQILGSQNVDSHSNAHTWLSTVLTNHATCLDGLSGPARSFLEPSIKDLMARARTSLAMVVAVSPAKSEFLQPLVDKFPSWVTSRDRKLLQTLSKDMNADFVVAKDGSGNFKTIKQAIAAVPDNSKFRIVVYVKKGLYKENVEIGKKKKNVMLTGDGKDLTIITGSLNVVDGTATLNTGTLIALGDGFMAQDLWIQNTAGPEKHQAVALRVGADQSIINRCRLDAFQDTLYTHTNRQFYRDSYITGTVDFIFGNAAVVFQNCQIVARKPMKGQNNMVTAQGRVDPNQNTGTSIQKCNVVASSDLQPVKGTVRTYLGRPWKAYSRTVFMQSTLGDHIDPSGWAPWSEDFSKTLYYGEYMNNGPGAGVSKRVKWAGYRVITSAAEANKFTVAQLIQGGFWLKSSGVAYTEGL